jgi:hypothetical protein
MYTITHCVASLPLPFHHQSSRQFIEWLSLSLSWVSYAAAVSHQLCHLKQDYWWEGPASYMGFPLPCAPGSVGRKPCGQGPPQLQPDGAGQFGGKVVDKNVQDEDEDDDDDDEEDDKTSSDRWVSGSGSPWSFCLALWGPLGLWRLWFLCRALQ